MKRPVILVFLLCASAFSQAPETPYRLFFSDAKLSFTVPDSWEIPSAFPSGPLLIRKTAAGRQAAILCQISNPVKADRLTSDAAPEVLQSFALQDLARLENARRLDASTATVAGLNAYEVTWQVDAADASQEGRAVYFFSDNRFYALALRTAPDDFPDLSAEFEDWLGDVRRLSRADSGHLDAPAHGGLWVHQTGGAKIAVPEEWLIGVADDRQLGATLARDKMHVDFTANVEVVKPPAQEFSRDQKAAARQTLEKKRYTVTSESEEPFHGLPCYCVFYEDTAEGRFIRGEDLWVVSPRARWLFSVEGDGALVRQMADAWQALLDGIHFYE